MISVSHLTRTFGALRALDDVSFEVGRGEVVGLLGPNGAGKTTALRILAGYLPATSGAARVAGFDVARQSLAARSRIGYLPESVPLYRELRVEEMLAFQARLHRIPRRERARRIEAALAEVELTDRRRALVGNLSRGLRQRAGIAVALLPRPEVLILDEPTSGLDPLQRIEVRGMIRRLAERHTVLVSSHILPEIEAVCPRVVILHRGRVVADGTPGELVAKLAGASHVRIEAVVGADVAAAVRLLGGIRGVREVLDRGRVGVHHQFELACEEDLREEAGAIAAARGWALRELSWRRPTLESLFATLVAPQLPESLPAPREFPPHAPEAHATGISAGVQLPAALTQLSVSPAHSASPRAAETVEPPPAKRVYNLNPFDAGATRDLSRPKSVEPPAPEDPA